MTSARQKIESDWVCFGVLRVLFSEDKKKLLGKGQ